MANGKRSEHGGSSGGESGHKPDYKVWAAQGEQQGQIGVGWKQEDGSINIVLNPFLVLDTRQENHLTLRLYPIEENKPKKFQQSTLPF